MSDDLLSGLNAPQQQAAGIRDGAVLVLAGAGSGKTRLLTHRVAWLVEQGVRPWQILAVTFTNKAAAEMKARVGSLLEQRGHGGAASELTVSTFHSMCARFLRRDIEPLGWTRSFTIYDADDQKRLLKGILDDLKGTRDIKPAVVRRHIDQAKNKLWSPLELAQRETFASGDPTPEAYRRYEAALKAANAVDFNDLVNLVVRLWAEHPEVADRYRRRYRYLLVDEYQDTNHAQYQLVQLLAAPGRGGHGNVMVVGDDDQSIYAFRGADIRNILDFKSDFPDATVVRLEQNYRSTGHILDAANAVVANNRGRMDKALWTDQGQGEAVRLITTQDETEEANQVVAAIREGVRAGRSHGDFAVIYRTNAASRAFEQALLRARIPHVLVGSRKFYERREVRDMVGYLKLLLNPADGMAFARIVNVPRRGVGAKSLATIRAQAVTDGVSMYQAARAWSEGRGKAKTAVRQMLDLLDRLRSGLFQHPPSELLEILMRETGYAKMLQGEERGAERLENIHELARAIEEEQVESDDTDSLARLQDFLDRASLAGQADELPEGEGGEGGRGDTGRVTLLTSHLCKGLEFPVVFVAGMHEGGFPHWNARESEEDVEEERRLVYVAMTRAQRLLYLTRSRRRMKPGQGWQDVMASRFLAEIPRQHLQRVGGGVGRRRGAPDRDARAARLGFSLPSGGSARPARRRSAHLRQRSLPDVTSSTARLQAPRLPAGEHRTIAVEDPDQLEQGARVVHPKLGVGTIRRTEGRGQNLKLTIHFDSAGRKVIYARFVQLELLQ